MKKTLLILLAIYLFSCKKEPQIIGEKIGIQIMPSRGEQQPFTVNMRIESMDNGEIINIKNFTPNYSGIIYSDKLIKSGDKLIIYYSGSSSVQYIWLTISKGNNILFNREKFSLEDKKVGVLQLDIP